MSHVQIYHPRVSFQDTNVVGNVYFLTYFRWQAECRDAWIRQTRPNLWKSLRAGETRLQLTHWSSRFDDPLGATIGDAVRMTMTLAETANGISASSECVRSAVNIASGRMQFRFSGELGPPRGDLPLGPCYAWSALCPQAYELNPLDLLAWQGKCREFFLADHAPQALRSIARQELVLQTSSASIEMLRPPALPLEEMRIELRLETLQCGRMGVRFDYFVQTSNGGSLQVAVGQQRMSSKRPVHAAMMPCPLPPDILHALRGFTHSERLREKIDEIADFQIGNDQELIASDRILQSES